jgi:hypothetical protein
MYTDCCTFSSSFQSEQRGASSSSQFSREKHAVGLHVTLSTKKYAKHQVERIRHLEHELKTMREEIRRFKAGNGIVVLGSTVIWKLEKNKEFKI